MRSEYIITEDEKKIKSKENATLTTNPVNNNRIITKNQAASKDKAMSLARGLSAPCLYFDEPEFTNYIDIIVANSYSTYDTASRNAIDNGASAFRCFTCTPGDLDSSAGVAAEKLLDKTVKWDESFYDKGPEYVLNMIDEQGDDCNHIVYIEYSYRQIGLDDAWFRKTASGVGDKLTVRRELLLQRLHGSSLSPYDREDIEYIISTERKPIDKIWLLDYYYMDIYETLNREIPYLVGVDCASGTLKDNNAITVIDPYTLRPVAELECSFIGETNFEELLKELVKEHIPRAVLCIERNNVGDGIIDHLLHSEISNRIYYDKTLDLMGEINKENTTTESMLKHQAMAKTYHGVWTSGRSRDDMFKILSDRVYMNKDDFITHNVIRDLSRLIQKPNGKIEAGSDFHDDSIMSYLIAMYVYVYGNNLAVFGITKGHGPDFVGNQGMRRPEEINPELVDKRLIQGVMIQEAKEARMHEWENMMKDAIQRAQSDSYKMAKSGLSDTIYTDTVSPTSFESDVGDVPLTLFDDLNGFGQNRYDMQNTYDPMRTLGQFPL